MALLERMERACAEYSVRLNDAGTYPNCNTLPSRNHWILRHVCAFVNRSTDRKRTCAYSYRTASGHRPSAQTLKFRGSLCSHLLKTTTTLEGAEYSYGAPAIRRSLPNSRFPRTFRPFQLADLAATVELHSLKAGRAAKGGE